MQQLLKLHCHSLVGRILMFCTLQPLRERTGGGERDTDTDDLFISAIVPHEGVQVDDLPPHSTYCNYACEQENQRTNYEVLD